jgi:hypothetical protein
LAALQLELPQVAVTARFSLRLQSLCRFNTKR